MYIIYLSIYPIEAGGRRRFLRGVGGESSSAMAVTGDSFFSCFQRDDLWEALAQHPATWPHVADTGFQAAIERLRQGGATQAMASEAMNDPRVMQAVAALQGWRLDVSEADIKHAESVGDVKKRDAVQMSDLEVAHAHGTVDAAKAAGNELFKAQEFSKALACYMRALELLRRQAAGEAGAEAARAAVASTLSSNAAATLLKLKRPKEALAACDEALRSAAAGSDLRKVYFRKAQARSPLDDETLALP
jgi:tetratricopeptide (TPR) repeat protein